MDETPSSSYPPDSMVARQESSTRKRRELPQDTVELLEQPVTQKRLRNEPLTTTHQNPPPAFWDGLSKIQLERSALKELKRRNAILEKSRVESEIKQPLTQSAVHEWKQRTQLIPVAEYLSKASQEDIDRIKNFARRGGPDLTDLRGVCGSANIQYLLIANSISRLVSRAFIYDEFGLVRS
jgi:hypothetical protein